MSTKPTTTEAATTPVSKYRGVSKGMRVQEFQNWQIASNPERKLTDKELLDEMRAEFPNATGKIFTADLPTRLSILGAVRRLALAGKHGPCPIPMPAASPRIAPAAETPAETAPAAVAEPKAKKAKGGKK